MHPLIETLIIVFSVQFIGLIVFSIIWYTANKKQKIYISKKLGYEIVNEMKYGIFYYYFVVKYIKNNDKYGLCINKKNIIPPIYDEIKIYKKNVDIIPVKKDGKWGFVSITENRKHELYESIPPIYDAVENFSVIKALVTLNGEQFYINRKGKRV